MNDEKSKSLNISEKKLMQNIVEISKYKRKLNDLSPQKDRIKNIKRMVSNGQYQIDTQRIAKKMLS